MESSFELVGWLFVNLCKIVQHVESNAKGQLKVGVFFVNLSILDKRLVKMWQAMKKLL